jgi:hypothetical protein
MPMIGGSGIVRGPEPPAGTLAATTLGHVEDTADATTYNGAPFQGLALGAAAADKYIVMPIGIRAAGSVTISSATFDGMTGTALTSAAVNTTGGNTSLVQWFLFDARANSNTTGDLSVVLSGGATRCMIAWVSTAGGTPTFSAASTDTTISASPSGNMTASLNVPANGVALAASFNVNATSNSYAWTGLSTEICDHAVEASVVWSAAFQNYSAAQTPLSITAAITNNVGSSTEVLQAISLSGA